MERRTFIQAASAATTIGITGMAGCIGNQDEPADEQQPTETEAQDGGAMGESPGGGEQSPTEGGGGGGETATNTIKMFTEGGQYYFDPVGLYLQKGDKVTWTIASGSHSSTSYQDRIPDGAEPWDSGILSGAGSSFSYTFDAEGTYDYYCTPHRSLGMVARVVVGQPGGPGADGDPPDGNVPSSETIVQKKVVPFGSKYASQ